MAYIGNNCHMPTSIPEGRRPKAPSQVLEEASSGNLARRPKEMGGARLRLTRVISANWRKSRGRHCLDVKDELYLWVGMESPFNRRSADDSCHDDRGGILSAFRRQCFLRGRMTERH